MRQLGPRFEDYSQHTCTQWLSHWALEARRESFLFLAVYEEELSLESPLAQTKSCEADSADSFFSWTITQELLPLQKIRCVTTFTIYELRDINTVGLFFRKKVLCGDYCLTLWYVLLQDCDWCISRISFSYSRKEDKNMYECTKHNKVFHTKFWNLGILGFVVLIMYLSSIIDRFDKWNTRTQLATCGRFRDCIFFIALLKKLSISNTEVCQKEHRMIVLRLWGCEAPTEVEPQ